MYKSCALFTTRILLSKLIAEIRVSIAVGSGKLKLSAPYPEYPIVWTKERKSEIS
jgi:hypothetical protein